jgi:hypothetical protein
MQHSQRWVCIFFPLQLFLSLSLLFVLIPLWFTQIFSQEHRSWLFHSICCPFSYNLLYILSILPPKCILNNGFFHLYCHQPTLSYHQHAWIFAVSIPVLFLSFLFSLSLEDDCKCSGKPYEF